MATTKATKAKANGSVPAGTETIPATETTETNGSVPAGTEATEAKASTTHHPVASYVDSEALFTEKLNAYKLADGTAALAWGHTAAAWAVRLAYQPGEDGAMRANALLAVGESGAKKLASAAGKLAAMFPVNVSEPVGASFALLCEAMTAKFGGMSRDTIWAALPKNASRNGGGRKANGSVPAGTETPTEATEGTVEAVVLPLNIPTEAEMIAKLFSERRDLIRRAEPDAWATAFDTAELDNLLKVIRMARDISVAAETDAPATGTNG